ncbi:MAG: 7-cyano-7-deazaguanine synthase QueC [Candidatus Omnitrophica bacterium]|nr:7-cyano-7-deazaguanine synthase QueC [Candidatus Omnitrophota bacterium]
MKRAIVLLSGGLDSATTLYLAKKKGLECFCLIFNYGQRHKKEIAAAKKIAALANCPYKVVNLNFPWEGSSLLDKKMEIPAVTRSGGHKVTGKIPSTYVPARNIIFLSFALSYAEAIGASYLYIGAHAQDYSGYPDCRPQFFRAFQRMLDLGTKSGVEGKRIKILTPLINKHKAEIIRLGLGLGVPFKFTWSCYKGGSKPCGECDSCYFRAKGFKEIGLKDPL